jgi:hypothetical protein
LEGFETQHQTHVGRGENGGRTLLESNIVRSLTPVGKWIGGGAEFHAVVPVGARIAALLQADDDHILGVALLDGPPSRSSTPLLYLIHSARQRLPTATLR